MNLIEKVAKAISDYVMGEQSINLGMAATAAISAMPSIKWQKIETLPEEYKTNSKSVLLSNGYKYIIAFYNPRTKYWDDGDFKSKMSGFTHWAEINTPEEE